MKCVVCQEDKRIYSYNKCKKCYNREYRSRPEVKERIREYYSRPEVKERRKEYRSRPEVKERIREYYSRPEVKERIREYNLLRKFREESIKNNPREMEKLRRKIMRSLLR